MPVDRAFPSLPDLPLGRMLSLIEGKNCGVRFVILDCPTDSTLPFYLRKFKELNVTDVVRVCEPTYSTLSLKERGIQVYDWAFQDGGVPPAHIVRDWINLVMTRQQQAKTDGDEPGSLPTIAVHCVAGLGRAPVLVAIALIELGMEPLDAIEHIRRKRRGALNNRQIAYIDTYKRSVKPARSHSSTFFKSSFGRMFKIAGGKKMEITSH